MHGEGWGACMVKGGGHAWQRVGGMCGGGGMHDRGVHCGGACVAGEMATAAEGTHPTGMHSSLFVCLFIYFGPFIGLNGLQTHLHQNSTISYK